MWRWSAIIRIVTAATAVLTLATRTLFCLLAGLAIARPVLAQTIVPKLDPKAPLLTTAREIARYPSASRELQPPVKLEAMVTFIDNGGTVFLRDATGATFLRAPQPAIYQPGQMLAIQGLRYPGLYVGGITPRPGKVDILSMGPVPDPRVLSLKDLSTGQHHYELVEIEGVGRSVELTGETTATLKVNVDGGVLEVQFDEAPENAESFVDAGLVIRGLAAGAINDHRQLVYPYVRAKDGGAVTIVQPAPDRPFGTEDTPLASLFDFARVGPSHRVKISGTALGPVMDGSVFIRSGERSVRILTSQAISLQAGDNVRALGFPQMGEFSAMLADAVLEKSAPSGEPPAAMDPDPKKISSGALDADLVKIEVTIIQHLESENVFIVRTAGQTLRVLSPGHPLPKFAPGTRALFTGIWLVTEAKHGNYRATPTGHELWLRGPADISLLSAPPWWNARKLAITLAIVAGAGLLVLIWATMLHVQVARQVRVIEAKAQREAMIEERQRIAREFHDTLEQELAGLSLRLDAAVPRVSDEKARTLLEQLRHLLLRLQHETRDFVWDLRDESQHSAPLAASMGTLMDHLQTGTSIPIRFDAQDDLPPVPALAQHHLLRIAREAVNNAIKYSGAKTILVRLEQKEESVRLKVEDDGAGFDLAARSKVNGHFGLQGMKERVRKLGASLDLHSRPGEGTRVEVVLATGGPS